MVNRTKQLRERGLEEERWRWLYYKHQQHYIRQRLLAIKYIYEGKSRKEVSELIGCTYKTLTTWIDKFLTTGLTGLTEQITYNRSERLNSKQREELKKMLLTEKPINYGIDRNIWTAKIICYVIFQKWGVELKDSRVYEILDQLHLSHQKGHRDYANADLTRQTEFISTLKKT